MNTRSRLAELFDVILSEVENNRKFAERIASALHFDVSQLSVEQPIDADKTTTAQRRSRRRAPAAIDPLALYSEGEDRLRDALAPLSIEQLKDIVAEHGMDSNKLAMKWRTRERFEELITRTVRDRLAKGTVFRRDLG